MVDPLLKMMIDYLVTDRFPAKLPIGKLITKHGLVPAVEQVAEAAALRTELEALDAKTLQSRYHAAASENARAAEATRPFNQPYAKADFGHWAKLAYWKVDEGIALLLGRAPQFLVWDTVKGISSPVIWQFSRIREVATRAVQYKQLSDPGYPGAFVTWAKRFDFAVPAELEEKVAAFGHFMGDWYSLYETSQANYAQLSEQSNANSERSKALVDKWEQLYRKLSESSAENAEKALVGMRERNAAIERLQAEVQQLRKQGPAALPDKPLEPREHDSLRKLVIGMAVGGYGYDPNAARSKVIPDIVSDLERQGVGLSDDTVRKHLKDAFELLPPPTAPERMGGQ